MIKQVERDIIENELIDGQNTRVNIVKMIEMQELVASLVEEINRNSNSTLQFWSDLLTTELNGYNLEKLGILISKQNQ